MRRECFISCAMALLIVATGASLTMAEVEGHELKQRMAGYYEPVSVMEFTANVPETPLPLDLEKTANWQEVQRFVPEPARDLLARNAFVVTDAFRGDKVSRFYQAVQQRGLPVFVTSDSLLHLYHIQFDETLRHIEETQFFQDLRRLTAALSADSRQLYDASGGREREAARRCMAYFGVAAFILQQGEDAFIHRSVAQEVQEELRLIGAHAGFSPSPVFKYKEDYSQYVPRGHYTRSGTLKKYFRAMMWYGRMAFLIKGKTDNVRNALISDEEARIQTLAAFMITDMLAQVKLPDGRMCSEAWERIYAVTAYYVGFADDLTPWEYRDVIRRMPMNETMGVAELIDHRWLDLRKALAGLRSPEIYGGTGDVGGPPPQIATEADLDEALEATKGLRFMGQRYVPDSYVMGRLVYPSVGKFTGGDAPFTLVDSIRGFPRGLDVMAVLGSGRAREILRQLGDDAYQGYDEQLAKARERFQGLSQRDWNRNMYWSWLYSLGSLLPPSPDGYPSFMLSRAWLDKQLNAALGSWAQLRHDTILYAKQSYTMRATAMPMQPRMVEGYVEPVPEFYARLLALTRMTRTGLDDMNVLDDQSRSRLQALEGILRRLLDISVRELQNETLGQNDYQFIRSFGGRLKAAAAGVQAEGLETTIVADVHTDANSRQVLEEGTGFLRTIAVVYPMPTGDVVIGFGPVFSYYEFKQPMANRLTDEAWKEMLNSGKAPSLPEWTRSFSAP